MRGPFPIHRTPTASPQRPQDHSSFLYAKTEALQLQADIDLYTSHSPAQFHTTLAAIVAQLAPCSPLEQGEVFLLLCQSALRMQMSLLGLPLPDSFVGAGLEYLGSLLEGERPPSSRRSTSKIYRGKFKDSTERAMEKGGRTRLKDLLLIERYDVLLSQLFRELEAVEPKNCRLGKELAGFLQDSYGLAVRYLGAEEAKEYKANIEGVCQLGSGRRHPPKRPSYFVQQNYLLIGSAKTVPHYSLQPLRQQSQHNTAHRGSFSISSGLKTSSQKESTDPKLPREELHLKKNSVLHRSLKWGSGTSNNYPIRSSIMLHHHPPLKTVISNHFRDSNFKGLSHNSNLVISRSSELKITNPKRQSRKSRFQLLSPFEEEALYREFGMGRASSIQESEGSVGLCRRTSGAYSADGHEDQTNQASISPFFLFLQERQRLHLLLVEQAQESVLAQLRIKISQPQTGWCLTCTVPPEDSEDSMLTYQQRCQYFLSRHLRGSLREGRQLQLSLTEAPSGQQGRVAANWLRAEVAEEIVLMGFVRKVSTYFIHKSRFMPAAGCYLEGVRRKLISCHQRIPVAVSIRSRLMNFDLTMSFQEEEPLKVQRGSVLNYIQNEELEPFSSDSVYKLHFEHCALKEWEEILVWRVWNSSKCRDSSELQSRRKRGRKHGSSRVHKAITADESTKKLRRVAHNKSSIKLASQGPELESLYQESEFKHLHKYSTRRDLVLSERRIRQEGTRLYPTRKERDVLHRTSHFIEAVRTEKGYKLLKKSAVQSLEGFRYLEYEGYLERNPQLTRLWKGKDGDSPTAHHGSLKSGLDVREKQGSLVSSTRLISFVKPLRSEEHFLGYLVSEVKILTRSANRCIFVEAYWEKMQKHFIFTLSSEFFEKITDINTSTFWQHPFNPTDELLPKRREKSTSVMNSLTRNRDRPYENMSSSGYKCKAKDLSSLGEAVGLESVKLYHRLVKDTARNRVRPGLTLERGSDSLTNFNSLKSARLVQLKRQIVSHLKSKLVRIAAFVWKDHTLQLVIRPSDRSAAFQFSGRQLAVKNVISSPEDGRVAAATELVLIKYRENNLSKLNFYNQEGLNQISLEHIFIKNNADLQGRYYNLLHLSSAPFEVRTPGFYRASNHFFLKAAQKDAIKAGKLKTTAMKYALREEQKRFKYAEVLEFAKECCLPFGYVEGKRRSITKRCFVVPNRYKILQEEDHMLLIHLEQEHIRLKTLQGESIISLSMEKVAYFLPFIRKLCLKQLKAVILRRVLEDEDIIRICCVPEDG